MQKCRTKIFLWGVNQEKVLIIAATKLQTSFVSNGLLFHHPNPSKYVFPVAFSIFSKQPLRGLSYQFSRADSCKGMDCKHRALTAVHKCLYFLFLFHSRGQNISWLRNAQSYCTNLSSCAGFTLYFKTVLLPNNTNII